MVEEKSRYINRRHAELAEQRRKSRIAFAAAYAHLWRKRTRAGTTVVGIQAVAAATAGAGGRSKEAYARNRTQNELGSRWLRDPLVVSELERLGMVYDPVRKVWHDPVLTRKAGAQ